MSLEVLLIPLGIAAIAAIKEARSTDLCEKCKNTRITDASLLVEVLERMGAADLVVADSRITAATSFGPVTFQMVGKLFLGRVDGNVEALTEAMLAQVDATLGTISQARSVERIRERAAEMGLILVTENADDGTVQLVFEQA